MRILNLVGKLAACLMVMMFATTAVAADFPNRPINLIVGYKAGGGTDTYARALAKVAPKYLDGQPIVVVNKPGGGGFIGARFVADQPANGYSLYLSSAGSMLLRNLAKPQVVSCRDFRMVATIGELTPGVFVPASSPIDTMEALIEKLGSPSHKLRWGHTGRGNVWHIAGVGLIQKNEVSAKDVPFKGGSGTRSALIADQIGFAVMGAQLVRGFEKDIRLLGVLSDQRHPAAKEVLTVQEMGIDYVKVTTPMVVMAPKRVKSEVVELLSDAFVAMTHDPEFKGILDAAGLPAQSMGAEATTKMIDDSRIAWEPLVRGQ